MNIEVTLPEYLLRDMPVSSQEMELLGKGNNAVVLRDQGDGAVYKIYGHDRLLNDQLVYQRIESHYLSEVTALEQLSHIGCVPHISAHGRIHPSSALDDNGVMPKSAYGWLRMNYIEGIRQDIVAVKYQANPFTADQLDDGFYHSVGLNLGKLHKAGKDVVTGVIALNVHEKNLNDARAFVERQLAKWEAGDTAEQYQAKREAILHRLKAAEETYAGLIEHGDSYSFIHGDFAKRNMLYALNKNGAARAISILDFGQAGIGLAEYDMMAMRLWEKPATLQGYAEGGGEFSPDRCRAVARHFDAVTGVMAMGRKDLRL